MKTHQKDPYSTCSTSRSPNGTLAYIGTSISFKAGIITFANVLNKKKIWLRKLFLLWKKLELVLMSVLEPQDEDSNKTSSIPRSKYLEKENFTAQLYVIQLCLSNILNLLLFAKKKKARNADFCGSWSSVMSQFNTSPFDGLFFFSFVSELVLAFRHHYSIFHL